MSRFAKHRRIYYFEDPVFEKTEIPHYAIRTTREGVHVVIPYLPESTSPEHKVYLLIYLLNELLEDEVILDFNTWYYTPKALSFTRHLNPIATVYDCMKEHSDLDQEQEMLTKADLVFTSTPSMQALKKHEHSNVHYLPSSIDLKHFSLARRKVSDPTDQYKISSPCIGFFGTLDERLNYRLIDKLAMERPEWNFVFIGPFANGDVSQLSFTPNVHFLGNKEYEELPSYFSRWDCAIAPFLIEDSTKFMNPTKIQTYLAAGKPVIATPLPEVVNLYGTKDLVYIAESVDEFVEQIETAIANAQRSDWQDRVDRFLKMSSWDVTWDEMAKQEWMLGGYRAVSKMKEPGKNQNFLPGGNQ